MAPKPELGIEIVYLSGDFRGYEPFRSVSDGNQVDVDERSEPARLFRLRCMPLFGVLCGFGDLLCLFFNSPHKCLHGINFLLFKI